jgi:hypothetical protein
MNPDARDDLTDERLARLAEDPAAEAETVRAARIRRDRELSPAERLDKLAAMCQQAALLRSARRVP